MTFTNRQQQNWNSFFNVLSMNTLFSRLHAIIMCSRHPTIRGSVLDPDRTRRTYRVQITKTLNRYRSRTLFCGWVIIITPARTMCTRMFRFFVLPQDIHTHSPLFFHGYITLRTSERPRKCIYICTFSPPSLSIWGGNWQVEFNFSNRNRLENPTPRRLIITLNESKLLN